MAVAPIARPRHTVTVRLLIAAVSALGLAILTVRGAELAQAPGSALLAVVVVAAAVAAADQFTLTLPHGGEEEQFALTDAVWVAAIVLAPPGAPTVGAAVGALAWQAAQRYEARKIAFNVGQVALALTAAELVWGLAGTRPAPDEPAAWALATVACAAAFLVNETTVALVISTVRSTPLRAIVSRSLRVSVLQWAGNVALGLLAALTYAAAPFGLVLVAVPLGIVYLAYREWVAGLVEREQMEDMARTAERIARDGDASARLPMIAAGGRLDALTAGLNRMLEQLDRVLARERNLLHEAARELEPPVRALRAELVADAANPSPPRCERAVREQLEKVASVVDEMRAVAGAGRPGELRAAPVALRPFLARVAEHADEFLQGRLTVEPPPPDAVARLDARWTERALLKLLHNAAVHGRGLASIELRAIAAGPAWRLEVSDEGGGVPAGLEDTIFEPFYHLSPEHGGAGLGLAFVRSVADAQGGAAGIRNRPGAGVTFWLQVPA